VSTQKFPLSSQERGIQGVRFPTTPGTFLSPPFLVCWIRKKDNKGSIPERYTSRRNQPELPRHPLNINTGKLFYKNTLERNIQKI
jgi:hypothetical protein